MRLEFPSKPDNIGLARVAVGAFAAQLPFTMDEIEEIKLAVSEAVSNAVVHAYKGSVGPVTVEAWIYPERLEVAVTDQGRGIDDVQWALQPAHTTEPEERLGIGLVIIQEYMDHVRIESAPAQGTRLRMSKAPERVRARP